MSNLFESNAVGVTTFAFEGNCAMTNADEANELEENVITAKKGKNSTTKDNKSCGVELYFIIIIIIIIIITGYRQRQQI